MSDALPLPPRPNLEQYKKRAKDLVKICETGNREGLRAWVTEWIESLVRLYELDVTLPREGHRAYTPEELGYRIESTVRRITTNLSSNDQQPSAICTLARAQFAIAREHGFASWQKFARHLEGLTRKGSQVSSFEAAADAIVSGDVRTLENLLAQDEKLVRARSTREHRSTLLHYVSANGIEDYRQKTPNNIVEITRLLLDAGADVNAESDAYGGRSTTLGLAATSCHPEAAGVQLQLMDLLIDRGAIIDGPDGGSAVNGCLHNGRGEAAEYFASRGARLDLEGAAGVGRLDIVRTFFNEDGSLKPPATEQQLQDGFAWACEFGRTSVVDFLVRRGMALNVRLKHNGQTGLHWAAYGGHVDVVKLLLDRGAQVDVRDDSYGGTPLGWALYAWGGGPEREANRANYDSGAYYEVIALLVRAGAKLDPEWYSDDPDRKRAMNRLLSDSRMRAALEGKSRKARRSEKKKE
jgi:ankyrin repeat protein